MSNRKENSQEKADVVIVVNDGENVKPYFVITTVPVDKAVAALSENGCEEAKNLIGDPCDQIFVRPWNEEVDSHPNAFPEKQLHWYPGMKK